MPKIITSYDPPPISLRQFDWIATTDDYQPGAQLGRGATEQEAINDLIEKLED